MSTSDLQPDDSTPAAGVSRRTMLSRSASAGLGIVMSGSIPGLLGSAEARFLREPGYGPLIVDPAGLLSLPEGFSYKIVSQAGVSDLEGGGKVPQDQDGMASFVRPGGGSVLVCNHEIGGSEPHKVPARAGLTFDAKAGGGTTTIEVDRNGNLVRQYVSLAGTHNNCAGGRTPWETWITCEETETTLTGGLRHGYNFEVDPSHRRPTRLPPSRSRRLVAFPTSRSPSTRSSAASTRPRTPANPTACCTAGRRRCARYRCARAR